MSYQQVQKCLSIWLHRDSWCRSVLPQLASMARYPQKTESDWNCYKKARVISFWISEVTSASQRAATIQKWSHDMLNMVCSNTITKVITWHVETCWTWYMLIGSQHKEVNFFIVDAEYPWCKTIQPKVSHAVWTCIKNLIPWFRQVIKWIILSYSLPYLLDCWHFTWFFPSWTAPKSRRLNPSWGRPCERPSNPKYRSGRTPANDWKHVRDSRYKVNISPKWWPDLL